MHMPRLIAVVGFIYFASAFSAEAGYSLVTDRASLGGTDTIDWGTLNLPPLTPISNPFSINSNGGVPVTVSEQTPGVFYSDTSAIVWNGNFAPGDALLYSGPQYNSAGGPILIDFGSNLVSGGGTQIEPNAFLVPFTAQITAYDSQMNVLASFTEDGFAAPTNDNTAIFIGIASTAQDIRAISVDVLTPSQFADAHDFAINRFDFRTRAVPEPSSCVLLGLGCLAIFGARSMRRRTAKC